MRNEDLQHPKQYQVDPISQTTTNPQELVLSAYIKEKDIWEKKLNAAQYEESICLTNLYNLKSEMILSRIYLTESKELTKSENNIWIKTLNLLGIKTKAQKKHIGIMEKIELYKKEIKVLELEYKIKKSKYDNLYLNPPNTTQYELAMINNNLFKPR